MRNTDKGAARGQEMKGTAGSPTTTTVLIGPWTFLKAISARSINLKTHIRTPIRLRFSAKNSLVSAQSKLFTFVLCDTTWVVEKNVVVTERSRI